MQSRWGWAAARNIALVAGMGCGSESSGAADPHRQCTQLREQLVGIQMQNVTADVDQHRAAYRAALGDSFITRCVDEMSAEDRECELTAKDAAALLACHTD